MMNRFYALLLLAFMSCSVFAQPEIKFDKEKHDFGKVNEADGEARTVFTYTNTGTAPLIIQDVQASCDCTSPAWTQEPVLPGKTGSVTVVYDTKGRPGVFDKTINVYHNAGKAPLTTLQINGEVVGGLVQLPIDAYTYEVPNSTLRFDTKHISLGQLQKDQTVSARVNVLNTGEKEVKIVIEKTAPHLEVICTPMTVRPGKVARINIVYDASKKQGTGFLVDSIKYTLNGEQNAAYSIAVTAEL